MATFKGWCQECWKVLHPFFTCRDTQHQCINRKSIETTQGAQGVTDMTINPGQIVLVSSSTLLDKGLKERSVLARFADLL